MTLEFARHVSGGARPTLQPIVRRRNPYPVWFPALWLVFTLATMAVALVTPRAADAQTQAVLAAMPSIVDATGVQELTQELTAVPATTTVVVVAPASPKLAGTIGPEAFANLQMASRHAQLVIVGGPGDIVPAFKAHRVRYVGYRSAKQFDAYVKSHPGATRGLGSLASLIGAPGNGSGGQSVLTWAVVALVAGGVGLGVRRLHARIAEPRPAERPRLKAPVGSRHEAVLTSPRPAHRPRRPVLANVPGPLRNVDLPTSGPARVRSELDPDGYVELDGCMRRVRWAAPRTAPPAPGQWVEVADDHGRMIAVPSRQVRKGGQR